VKPVAFDYVRAGSIEEVLDLLLEAGDDAVLLAGGMSLGPMLNLRAATPSLVIDLNRTAGLDGITANGAVTTGAMLRQAQAMRDDLLMTAVPLLAKAMPSIGHYQTRSRGTLGGSIAHADPSAELPLCLLTLGGEVELQSKDGLRRVAADEFFEGVLTTARQPTEMITAIHWPRRSGGFGFVEEAQRHGDFALTAAAVWIELDAAGNLAGGRLGLGGVEDRPVAFELQEFAGAPLDEKLAAQVAGDLAGRTDPMDDHVADAAYRRQLAGVLGRRALMAAAGEAGS
jgi:2-furoyl-CoA dehydrogenase FAD binding subunit